MSVTGAAFLLVAGFGAGLSGTMAGLASLFSYPALLAVGLPATTANITNTVALTFSAVGGAIASQRELRGQRANLARFAAVVVAGGASGAALLLLTPPGAFERIVPVLVAGASVVLLLQPRLRQIAQRREGSGAGVLVGVYAVAVYGGYFGAAAGVMLLALLLVGLPVSLLQGNALKNVLLGVANGVAALGFAVFGLVAWWAVPPLAIGILAGSYAGPTIARRLPATPLRVGIALAGLALAVVLAVEAW